MLSEKVDFLPARLGLQTSDVHDGNRQRDQCRRRRQRSENKEDRKRVDGVPNNAKWAAENQLRSLFGVDADSPGSTHFAPAGESDDGRADADCGPDEADRGPWQVVSRTMKMVAKSQPRLDTPRHDRWNPNDSNPSSGGLGRN